MPSARSSIILVAPPIHKLHRIRPLLFLTPRLAGRTPSVRAQYETTCQALYGDTHTPNGKHKRGREQGSTRDRSRPKLCWIHLGAESNPIISRTWAEMDAAEDAPARVHNLRKARKKYNPVKLSGRYMYVVPLQRRLVRTGLHWP